MVDTFVVIMIDSFVSYCEVHWDEMTFKDVFSRSV